MEHFDTSFGPYFVWYRGMHLLFDMANYFYIGVTPGLLFRELEGMTMDKWWYFDKSFRRWHIIGNRLKFYTILNENDIRSDLSLNSSGLEHFRYLLLDKRTNIERLRIYSFWLDYYINNYRSEWVYFSKDRVLHFILGYINFFVDEWDEYLIMYFWRLFDIILYPLWFITLYPPSIFLLTYIFEDDCVSCMWGDREMIAFYDSLTFCESEYGSSVGDDLSNLYNVWPWRDIEDAAAMDNIVSHRDIDTFFWTYHLSCRDCSPSMTNHNVVKRSKNIFINLLWADIYFFIDIFYEFVKFFYQCIRFKNDWVVLIREGYVDFFFMVLDIILRPITNILNFFFNFIDFIIKCVFFFIKYCIAVFKYFLN